MPALLLALALLTAAAPGAAAPAEPPANPAGSPNDDYGFVAWCYGALRGYLDLHDEVMPEVTRIESAFRRPGSNLAEDLAVYEQMQATGARSLATLAAAMQAAEKASLRPINADGAASIQHGRATWRAAATVPKARLAQEWMSWSLPAACEATAKRLEERSRLGAAALQANAPPDPLAAPEAPVAAPPAQ